MHDRRKWRDRTGCVDVLADGRSATVFDRWRSPSERSSSTTGTSSPACGGVVSPMMGGSASATTTSRFGLRGRVSLIMLLDRPRMLPFAPPGSHRPRKEKKTRSTKLRTLERGQPKRGATRVATPGRGWVWAGRVPGGRVRNSRRATHKKRRRLTAPLYVSDQKRQKGDFFLSQAYQLRHAFNATAYQLRNRGR